MRNGFAAPLARNKGHSPAGQRTTAPRSAASVPLARRLAVDEAAP